MNFEEDNKFSDNCIDSKCLKKHIIKSKLFGEEYVYDDKSGSILDTHNNIDGYINEKSVQMHMQRIQHVKGSIDNYHAFTKRKRHKTGAETELSKMIKNKIEGKEYPKYIIWAIIDPEKNKLFKIEIIDVDEMLENLQKNKLKYIKENNLHKINENFYKNSKYYKTYYNSEDGTEPLYLISETPKYQYQYHPPAFDFLSEDED